MRRLIRIIALILLLAPGAFAREQSLLARVTVYWAGDGCGSDRFTQQHKCATGMRLHSGHCAVDPRRIPYGSQVVFPDGACTAVDTGTAVINRKAARKAGRTVYERNAVVIDRFFETKGEALSWANEHPLFMNVRVVPPAYRPAPQPRVPMIASNPPPPVTNLAPARSNPPLVSNAPPVANSAPVSLAGNPLNRIGR